MNRRDFLLSLGATAAAGGCRTTQSGELPSSTGPGQTNEALLKVRLIGSGSACWEREPRTSKIFRRYSSVLIDSRFLIDYTWMGADMIPEGCKPKAIVYTHSHGDHYDPKAAVKLGVRHVFLHRSWIADARQDFERAVIEVGGETPVIHPLDVGVRFRLGPYEILPLPANHYTGKPYEQALIYKVIKLCKDGPVRLLYATDTSGLMSAAYFIGCTKKEPVTAAIMEATGQPGRKFDGLSISHSTADTVNKIFTTFMKPGNGHYMPGSPGQPVYLTHLGYYEWGQNTFEDVLPHGLALAHDGMEIEFRPLRAAMESP